MFRMKSFSIYICPLLIFGCFCLAEKPNFILIFTDDQGYGDLSCFGSSKIKTPNIDRIARDHRDGAEILETLHNNGVRIYDCRTQSYYFPKNPSWESELTRAQNESTTMSQRHDRAHTLYLLLGAHAAEIHPRGP